MDDNFPIPTNEAPIKATELAKILGQTPEAITYKFRQGIIKAKKTGPGPKAPWVTYPSWVRDAIERWNRSPQTA